MSAKQLAKQKVPAEGVQALLSKALAAGPNTVWEQARHFLLILSSAATRRPCMWTYLHLLHSV